MIKLSFQQGVFPESLKTTRVAPIFKKDNKLYEKCPCSYRSYSFLSKYKILFKKQFGSSNNHSTMHALISLVDLIKKHLDNEYFACGIFIDLQKAFDTVDHDILNLIIMVYVDWLIVGWVPFSKIERNILI